MNYSKIEGHDHLLRDLKTGAIINTNINEYESYMRTKKIKENELKKINNLESEVSSMKNDLNEIKDLLRGLVNGSR